MFLLLSHSVFLFFSSWNSWEVLSKKCGVVSFLNFVDFFLISISSFCLTFFPGIWFKYFFSGCWQHHSIPFWFIIIVKKFTVSVIVIPSSGIVFSFGYFNIVYSYMLLSFTTIFVSIDFLTIEFPSILRNNICCIFK